MIVYPHYIRNRSQWNAMWRDYQPHGYSRPILFPHSAKRVRDCRQNIPWLLWNALLTTPYVSEHYKYMFLVARDLCEMFVLYRGKHTTRHSTVGIWSEVRVYRTPATNIPWAGVLRLASFQTSGDWSVKISGIIHVQAIYVLSYRKFCSECLMWMHHT